MQLIGRLATLVPGMVPGSIGRNVVVVLVYLFVLTVLSAY